MSVLNHPTNYVFCNAVKLCSSLIILKNLNRGLTLIIFKVNYVFIQPVPADMLHSIVLLSQCWVVSTFCVAVNSFMFLFAIINHRV